MFFLIIANNLVTIVQHSRHSQLKLVTRKLVGSYLKLVWAWHSSAPACFQIISSLELKIESLKWFLRFLRTHDMFKFVQFMCFSLQWLTCYLWTNFPQYLDIISQGKWLSTPTYANTIIHTEAKGLLAGIKIFVIFSFVSSSMTVTFTNKQTKRLSDTKLNLILPDNSRWSCKFLNNFANQSDCQR